MRATKDHRSRSRSIFLLALSWRSLCHGNSPYCPSSLILRVTSESMPPATLR